MTSPAISVVRRAAEARALVHLEPDPVAERVEVALVEPLARRLAALGDHAGLLERLARSAVHLAAVDAGAHGRERLARAPRGSGSTTARSPPAARRRRRRTCASCRPSSGTPRSRGQMSTITGSPAPISPWPASCPIAPCAPWETITSSGRSQPRASHASCIAARTSSLVTPALLVDHPRGDAHRLVGGRLGAADARELGLGLRAAAGRERLGVDAQLDAAGAQVVGDAEREARTARARASRRSAAHARRHSSSSTRVARHARRRAARRPRASYGSMTSTPCGVTLSASSTVTVAPRRSPSSM